MSGVAIVIVTYNSAGEVGPCLDAALASGAESVVVVDNASEDATMSEIGRRGVRVIANSDNRGFAAAANQGFRATASPFVLLLNPDAVIQSGLDALREASEMPYAAGATGKLIGGDGRPQTGFMVRNLPTATAMVLELLVLNRMLPWNPSNRRYRGLNLDYDKEIAVEQPAGAFLMIRRAVWEELGGFDEKFAPLWFEDVDFCRRAIDRGYWFCYTPNAVAIHTGGHSIPKIAVEMRQLYWYRSLLRYSAKHFGALSFRAVSVAVAAGSMMRGAVGVFSKAGLRSLPASGQVVRLACRCALLGRKQAEA
jgi:GT2 family glycosyltransferase